MQGLQKNKYQFALLVLVNGFVGAMVGIERAVLSDFGKTVFGLEVSAALFSFIAAFGISKALSNYLVARLSKITTRKRILVYGWIAALPVPFLLMYASSWKWVIIANILLGINQGLAWSATVIMKIDLVGSRNRGLAMGINEFAGYLSVGLAAWLSAEIASEYGYAFFPFIPAIVFSFSGLLLTVFFVKDTGAFVAAESASGNIPLFKSVWKEITWKHKNLSTVSFNGMVNNMNDAVVWVTLPLLLLQKGYSISQVGIVAGVYPVVWGVAQLFTGLLGDHYCKKQVITAGMLLQALSISILAIAWSMPLLIVSSVLLGLGTALVYPNFITVVAENAHPSQRAESLGFFRLWRDSGYVIGALLSGMIAYRFGLTNTLFITAAITAFAGVMAQLRMCCTKKVWWKSNECIPAY